MATTLNTSGMTMGSSTVSVSGSAPSFPIRTFVNFDGQSALSNKPIRASLNVSTVADVAQGSFTVNFSTSLPDANYSVAASSSGSANHPSCAASIAHNVAPTTSSVRIYSGTTGGAFHNGFFADSLYTCIAIYR